MVQKYLTNATIVTMNKEEQVFQCGNILVENDQITAVGNVDESLLQPGAQIGRAHV